MRRIVRKSLEPDFDDPEAHDTDNGDAENTDTNNHLIDHETDLKNEDAAFNKMIDDALDAIHNFVPKRKRKEQAMFNDLCFENEKRLRIKNRGAPYYWHMPFRHDLFFNTMVPGETQVVDVGDDMVVDYEDREKVELQTSR